MNWYLETGSALIKTQIQNEFYWARFHSPKHILTTDNQQEVIEKLKEVEEYQKQGYTCVGLIAYEAAPALNEKMKVKMGCKVPFIWFGVYDKCEFLNYTAIQEDYDQQSFPDDWESELDATSYQTKIKQIKKYLLEGESYQVNFTYRLTRAFDFDPLAYFLFMDASQKSMYSSYFNIGSHIILSATPELFFRKERDKILCKPMKGTIARGFSFSQDEKQKQFLYSSEKQRAENVMIVDMLRNDLGKIAKVGSVQVEKLFEVETYPTLHQLTSTITARTESDFVEILQALFPCASITGAPKIRTMEIIAELENSPRGFYCGAIGMLTPPHQMSFQVAIRTLTVHLATNTAEFGTGGGVVWDSTDTDEWQESKTKMTFLFQKPKMFSLVETMKWTRKEGIFLYEEHLERLEQSAQYFQYPFDRDFITDSIHKFVQTISDEEVMIRMLLSSNGQLTFQQYPLPIAKYPYLIKLSPLPIQINSPYLYHKTTYREIYDDFLRYKDNCDDVLLWNERKEITETTKFNIVIEKNGLHLTPKEDCGLLNGCLRRNLIKKGQLYEDLLTLDDLLNCDYIYLINSVRGWSYGKIVE